ncbi:MAG: Txe/YoeB family addiction module toxin [Defluviitaleaceae bacterium]|nr:Txe/YoeB family addiction module toxin [Defluviitaleaceae bacterium]
MSNLKKERKIIFEPTARDEYNWWKANDQAGVDRIKALIKDIKVHPFTGIGKPEPLKHQRQGYWSRRINKIDRLVYKVTDEAIVVISCRHHYAEY